MTTFRICLKKVINLLPWKLPCEFQNMRKL